MDSTSKEQEILKGYIEKLSKSINYQQIKYELSNFLETKDTFISNDFKELMQKIISVIKSPETLITLSTTSKQRISFLESLKMDTIIDPQDQIFKPIHSTIESLKELRNQKIQQINLSNKELLYINQLMNQLISSYQVYIEQFIEKLIHNCKNNPKKNNLTLFKEPLILINDQLQFKQLIVSDDELINSRIDLLNNTLKKSSSNHNINTMDNNININDKIQIKIKRNNPVKEDAFYSFFHQLFNDQSNLITPTQFLILNNNNINNDNYNSFIQMSLFSNGTSLEKFLKENQDDILQTKRINKESFSHHFLIDLLLYPSNSKASHYILDPSTMKLIRVNNGNILELNESNLLIKSKSNIDPINTSNGITSNSPCESSEIKEGLENNLDGADINNNNVFPSTSNNSYKINNVRNSFLNHYLNLNNILFTMILLMQDTIQKNIYDKIIQQQPNLFILNWLISLLHKEQTYESLVKSSFTTIPYTPPSTTHAATTATNITSLPHSNTSLNDSNIIKNINNNQNDINNYLNNFYQKIDFPLKFKPGSIVLMLKRFFKIKHIFENYQKQQNTITHYELLKEVDPLAFHCYKSLSFLNQLPLQQVSIINNQKLDIKKLIIENSTVSSLDEANLQSLFQQVENYNCSDPSQDLSIKETIKELILNSDFGQFNNDSYLVEWWIETIIKIGKSNYFTPDEIQFSSSWRDNASSIILILLEKDSPSQLIKEFMRIIKLSPQELNDMDILLLLLNQHKTISDIKMVGKVLFLISNGCDVNKIGGKNQTPLEVAALNKLYETFKILIDYGAGKKTVHSVINKYYQSLTQKQKLDFKPYLLKLSFINPKITWKIALQQLLPLSSFPIPNNTSAFTIISTSTEGERLLSNEFYNQLFSSFDGSPRKTNLYGTRHVPLIQDQYGNGIYFKFFPQLPGTEIAINKLSEILFGYLTPYCEIASINEIPVLLVQQINGEVLHDVIMNNPEKLDQLDPSNISKQLTMSMITNNADGSLGNFIISPIPQFKPISKANSGLSYRLLAIDSDQCFSPSSSRQLKNTNGFLSTLAPTVAKQIQIPSTKPSLQVETCLFFLKQMNEPIHQDIVDSIVGRDILEVCEYWLIGLKFHHQYSIDHFKQFTKYQKDRKTVIGITFAEGYIKYIFSKLLRLQKTLEKKSIKSVTHFELLEILEPTVASRYKQILSNSIKNSPRSPRALSPAVDSFSKKFIEDYKTLKGAQFYNLTNSINSCTFILESRELPNPQDIIPLLLSNKLGPDQAMQELNDIKGQIDALKVLNLIKLNESIIDSLLEQFLKQANFNSLSAHQQIKLFNLIKIKDIRFLYIDNSTELTTSIFKLFNLDLIKKISISNCRYITSISSGATLLSSSGSVMGYNVLEMPVLTDLKVIQCDGLTTIELKARSLHSLKVIDCKNLQIFEVDAPSLKICNLDGSIQHQPIYTKLLEFEELEYLNISRVNLISIGLLEQTFFHFKNLKTFIAKSIKHNGTVYLNMPKVETIDFQDCTNLSYIKGGTPSLKSLLLPANLSSTEKEIITRIKKRFITLVGKFIISDQFQKEVDYVVNRSPHEYVFDIQFYSDYSKIHFPISSLITIFLDLSSNKDTSVLTRESYSTINSNSIAPFSIKNPCPTLLMVLGIESKQELNEKQLQDIKQYKNNHHIQKNNSIEDFLALETKISNLESKIKNKEEIHYSITLSDDTLFLKTLCYLFSAVFPFIIYILWISFEFIFGTVTEDYQNELIELNIYMEILLEDKNLQADLKSLQIYERVIKKKNNHRAQQQQPERLQEKPKIPQILNQWASKEIEPKENNTILGELKAINNHLSNFVVLRSLETDQLDLFLSNIINCAIYFENVPDDVKTISSLIVSQVFAQAHFDSNISQDHIDMIESYILELYRIINKHTMYRYHQIEGTISVFKHFTNYLQNNQYNVIIKDMVLIDLVWSSALNFFEDLEYLELKQEFRQLYNDTYYIVSNYFNFTSDTIRSENLIRFNNSIKNFWGSL
ncbi:hypothetical protein DICPUDRAFT_149351 [Dictyostelium purpureum]|uniref:Uncharacterized protein n=1 Tax=Dictyostelium purpureum TaxID=5786 RepID=F0ZDH0_DICPU|nr:uncharacterized protein DICPUDRAFT_149351 [Dictyostelium purpureum]EGC37979.1 hypothetical protein DICPUDRAFT_149351 [Dictyostelium purpureum]|eukprot:XP_003285463.1 hypothetical protein DICPUDRAFT_149351 [Dictyostelium purpureum]